MKKSLLLISILAAIVFISSCGDEELTGPIPVINISTDLTFAEVGQVVTFSNQTTDGASFEWDFGDGTTSQDENPTHVYNETGVFTVTITATGSGGRQSASTTDVTIGNRIFTGLNITAIPNDIIVGQIAENLEQADLPLNVTIDLGEPVIFTDELWTLLFIDNDEPFNDLASTELMFQTEFNPINAGSINPQTGFGQIPIVTTDNSFNIQVMVQIVP